MSYSLQHEWYEERRNRHFAILAWAFGLSIVAHLWLMVSFKDRYLEQTRTARVEEKAPTTVTIENIRQDPLQALANPPTGDPDASDGQLLSKGHIRELWRQPEAALTTPPARAPETISGAPLIGQSISPTIDSTPWQPRQEIIAITELTVDDNIAALPRRDIAAVERVAQAPDYVPAVDLTKVRFGSGITPILAPPVETRHTEDITAPETDHIEIESDPAFESLETAGEVIERFGEKPGDSSDYVAIDSRLMARMEMFAPPDEGGTRYFRFLVTRRDREVLPVVPKDIVFLQDSSNSLAEERLYFCRQALQSIIRGLNPGDRFNIVKFNNQAEFCFPDWEIPTEASLASAHQFIDGIRSEGETDIFASLSALRLLTRDPARPLVAILITDGNPTTGVLESSSIIGQFTKQNDDHLSIFALGTHGRANNYLLDMLTFCNRGSSTVVTSGRWDIGKELEKISAGVANPILSRIRVTADIESGADIHPLPSANLFADRPLDYYGRLPAGTERLVIQIRGQGGDAKCDVIFDNDLSTVPEGRSDIRREWARRKMHSLIGEYTVSPSSETLRQMRSLGRQYNIPIPYRREM